MAWIFLWSGRRSSNLGALSPIRRHCLTSFIILTSIFSCADAADFNFATSGAQLALAYKDDMQGCVAALNKFCPYLDPSAITASGSVEEAQNATVIATAANPVAFCEPNCVRARSNYDECWQGFCVKYFGSVGGATLSADGSTWSQLNGQNLTTFCTPYTSGAAARVSVSLLLLVLSGAAFAAPLF